MPVGIKQSLEVIALVDETADLIVAAKADGTINWKDLKLLGSAVVSLREALAGAQTIPQELDDLNKDEVIELYKAASSAVLKLALAIVK